MLNVYLNFLENSFANNLYVWWWCG